MYRIGGYKEIMPIGGNYDGGRDAQLCSFHCKDNLKGDTFFQYSLEKDWENKLYKELKKVYDKGHKISRFIFVTSQKITGAKMDKLRKQVKKDYGWELVIYSREWLRLQLEEANRDLAGKYLGIPEISFHGCTMQLSEIEALKDGKIVELISKGRYEEAIPKLKSIIEKSEEKENVFNGLAWCYYNLFDYKNALMHVNTALQINPQSLISKSIKGCILAEDGIETHSETKLLLAKDIFTDLIEIRKDRDSFYNLANTLSELGEHERAKRMFINSLKIDSKRAEIWKNLGTCYCHLGDHKRELICMDIALSINPNLVEALISKGVTLGVIYNKENEGLDLIYFAIKIDNSIVYRWPFIYYWKAKFLSNLGDHQEALSELDEGLRIAPDDMHLLNLKAQLLSQQWKIDSSFLSKAAEFFELRTRIIEGDMQSIRELALIYNELGSDDKFFCYSLKLFNFFAEFSIPLSREDIDAMDISKSEIIDLINNIYLYFDYEEKFSLNEYVNYFNIELNFGLKKTFWIYFGIIFAKTCEIIRNYTGNKEFLWNDVGKFSESLFIDLLPQITRILCKNYLDRSKEEKMGMMSELTVNLPYIALLETSREVGYLEWYYGASSDEIEDSISSSNVEAWFNNIIEVVVFNANARLNILKDETCKVFSKELVDLDLI